MESSTVYFTETKVWWEEEEKEERGFLKDCAHGLGGWGEVASTRKAEGGLRCAFAGGNKIHFFIH